MWKYVTVIKKRYEQLKEIVVTMLTLLIKVMAIYLQKNRRKIIWFAQPNNMVVKTNVGERFFMSGEKIFKKLPLNKIFNKNTIKICNSCNVNFINSINNYDKTVMIKKNKKIIIITNNKTIRLPL